MISCTKINDAPFTKKGSIAHPKLYPSVLNRYSKAICNECQRIRLSNYKKHCKKNRKFWLSFTPGIYEKKCLKWCFNVSVNMYLQNDGTEFWRLVESHLSGCICLLVSNFYEGAGDPQMILCLPVNAYE